ncbi:MAG: 3-phosphoshikimate 1-carboxyvinyltransferase [Anaerolineae bacterium]
MNHYSVSLSTLKGTLVPPASKSHTLRALLFALMGRGVSIVRNFLESKDTETMISAIRAFGANIRFFPHHLVIEGVCGQLKTPENVIDAGNSGLVLRLIGALATLCPGYTVITGDHSIRYSRPLQPLLEGLRQLQAFAVSSKLDGHAPLIVKGPLRPGVARLAGEDSQPVSGLLIATSFLEGFSQVVVSDPGEKPWIDMTLHWLRKLGAKIEHQDYEHYAIFGNLSYSAFDVTIPSDWSTIAYPIAAALLTSSEIVLQGIDMDDVQGDKKILDIFAAMGALIEIDALGRTLIVRKSSSLKGIKNLDINDFIDALPILAVVSCFAEGETELVNAKIARSKESDRIRAMAVELRKMGANIEEHSDGLRIAGASLKGAHLNSHGDHRVALALAVAALAAEGQSLIANTDCIAKTYPSFVKDFQRLGVNIQEVI